MCDEAKVVPLPIFVKIQSGVLNVASQYISEGMAQALAKLLRFGNEKNSLKIHEINLDDNGMKDEALALILEALADSAPHLKILNYNKNGIGMKSV